MTRPIRIADLRGAARIAARAVEGVTDVVEGVHRSVWNTLGIASADAARTHGITGFVYGSVRGMTRWVGGGADSLLGALEPLLDTTDAPPDNAARDALLAALNGVMGDRLAADGNPLAIPMQLRDAHGAPWSPTAPATGRIVLLLHGLCMHDGQWRRVREGGRHDHGAALAAAHGDTPLYLRYNSGRAIADNGIELADLLEDTLAAWPVPIEHLAVIGHSMGGLLIRSAAAAAATRKQHWLQHLSQIVFLGTPHHGAPLERAGHWLDRVLASTPYTRPFAALGRVRSAGITDLRHGRVIGDTDDNAPPLPTGVDCYAVAATLAAQRGTLADRLLGDGLVPMHSTLGRHRDAARTLAIPRASQHVVYRTGHIELLHSDDVRRQLLAWLAPA